MSSRTTDPGLHDHVGRCAIFRKQENVNYCMNMQTMGGGMKAAIAGASGYAGGELLRLLLGHPEIEIGAVTAASSAGTRLGSHQPHLVPLAGRVIERTTRETLAGHDVVFLALPHGESAALARPARRRDPDRRLRRRLPAHRPGGLDRILRRRPRRHLALRPARAARPAREARQGHGASPCRAATRRPPRSRCSPPSRPVSPSPTSWWSPRAAPPAPGRSPKTNLLGSEVMGAVSAYGVGGVHRHTPEMEQNLSAVAGQPVTVSFTPTLAPMPRGILATCVVPAAPGTTPESLREAYEEAVARRAVRRRCCPRACGRRPR